MNARTRLIQSIAAPIDEARDLVDRHHAEVLHETPLFLAQYEGIESEVHLSLNNARACCDDVNAAVAEGRSWDWSRDEDGTYVQFWTHEDDDRPLCLTGGTVTEVTVHRSAAPQEKDTATSAATSTPTEQVIYRAEYEHESIPLGLYTTLAAARAHCEGQLRSEYPTTVSLAFDWIGDEDDPEQPWELVAEIDGGAEQLTGYVVTPLTVAAEYDPEAEG